ncbi:MAG: tRNA (5-methylaminomethyl-2-thiouridine)(34)-methyltransferase MnmD [Alphaproteobacteria bacterium]|nr:tRNA (5-methylaminomethyl-2-thiouridine)(34)-methyltransferase MnmD [Alphaproteobacteria bacterium]
MSRMPLLASPVWEPGGAPVSTEFGDVYFSRDGGLAETDAVFLQGCGLPERWRARTHFAIGELGFGSGLNALAAWRRWRNTRCAGAVLHFVSIERAPWAVADARRAHAAFPELAPLSERLCARWPVRAYGPQRIWFDEDGFCLTVIIADVMDALRPLRGAFDAWFLDGFAPARNGAMWDSAVFSEVARLSAAGARAATYTVAGDVRRGLGAVGFAVEKKPGFGAKRERLEAVLVNPPAEVRRVAPQPRRVGIVGGGIAAASAAHAVRRRGAHAVIVTDRNGLASGASGNPAALVMPRLDRGDTAEAALHRAAYLHAIDWYGQAHLLDACGALYTPRAARAREALADLVADPPLPEDWMHGEGEGVLHRRAGVVRPTDVVRAFAHGADIVFNTPVTRLERSAGCWALVGDTALDGFDAVVLANGPQLGAFAQTAFLPLEWTQGQIEWGAGAGLSRARADGAYALPIEDGILFGATHDRLSTLAQPQTSEDARVRNIAALRALDPSLGDDIAMDSLRSRASIRTATPDRSPIAGQCPDTASWDARALRLAGLYVFGGLGSRGFTLAPLLADSLASDLFDEPQALPQRCLAAVDPARFLKRSRAAP